MAKWHGYGRCKTRLAKDIGKANSAKVQRVMTNHTISVAKSLQRKKIIDNIQIPIQGGLDPKILLTDQKTLKIEVEKYLNIFKDHPYIFNLGHGILPETKIEMVEELIKIVRNFK